MKVVLLRHESQFKEDANAFESSLSADIKGLMQEGFIWYTNPVAFFFSSNKH